MPDDFDSSPDLNKLSQAFDSTISEAKAAAAKAEMADKAAQEVMEKAKREFLAALNAQAQKIGYKLVEIGKSSRKSGPKSAAIAKPKGKPGRKSAPKKPAKSAAKGKGPAKGSTIAPRPIEFQGKQYTYTSRPAGELRAALDAAGKKIVGGVIINK